MAKPNFNNASKKKSANTRVVGDVRQTQLITTYGVGSIVDFVKDTIMVAGVDDWDSGDFESQIIRNENLQSLTNKKYFISPKVGVSRGWIKSKDIAAFSFPEMLYCTRCKRFNTVTEVINVNPNKPNKCCLSNKKTGKPCNGTLVASRFVLICENGHIEDFPYSWWIHGNSGCPKSRTPRISMYNVGERSDIDSLWIKCEDCEASRPMAGAFAEFAFGGVNGYPCKGNHPHLKSRANNQNECTQKLKARLRSSSGVYFPVVLSALQIPPWSEKAVKIIEKHYEDLILMEENAVISLKRHTNRNITLEQLLKAFELVKQNKIINKNRNEADIYFDEYSVLSQGDISYEDDYSAFSVDIPVNYEPFFEKITVVDKLTVTEALKGFTRLKPWDGSDEKLVPLSTYKKEWLPAVELHGEGIFFQLNASTLTKWKYNIGNRYEKMETELRNSYLNSRLDRFSPEYILLHTFAHLLIRQIADECGYSTASLKEKIYNTFVDNNNAVMHGVLIYLASSDCDGSLGGLISIAQNKERLRVVLDNMLHKASWCSADPLCITSTEQGFNSLNYSACHDCVLLPETSCEYRNVLLDRVAIVGTTEQRELGFMGEICT